MFRKTIRYISKGQAFILLQQATLLVLVLALALVYNCDSDSACPPGYKVGWCVNEDIDSVWYCCFTETGLTPDNCCPFPLKWGFQLLSQIPRPDLSYTNLDGFVDYGRTILKVEIPAQKDYFETKLKGRVAIDGGVCPTSKCPLKVVLFELTSIKKNLSTAKGKPVSGLFARNANTWTGTRLKDGTIIMDATNKLALEATIDGQKRVAVLNPNAWFKGFLYYNKTRLTEYGPLKNNLIKIAGNFADKNTKAFLKFSIWATNCEPVAKASVQCMPGMPDIETGLRGPGYLRFTSTFKRLGNMQSSQDLCDALLAPDYTSVCSSGGSDEFPTFSCKKKAQPPANNPAEIAKQLKFRWQDAGGNIFSEKFTVNLNYMPVFPVKLTVENKWGKKVTSKLLTAPQGSNCPKPSGLLAFGVVSSSGNKESGSSNWSSSFKSSSKQYEITFSGENYYFLDYATVVTAGGWGGFCTTSSRNGRLVVECYDYNGNLVVPASLAFVCFKKSNEMWAAKELFEFGVVSSAGNKESGSPYWSSSFNSTNKQYEITFTGETYYSLEYATVVVTPSFGTGKSGFCTTGSLNGKLVVQCYDYKGNPVVPASFSFVYFKKPEVMGVTNGVVTSSGNKGSGSPNWSSSYSPSSKLYEITFSGENYYYLDYATVVTPSFYTGKSGFCTTNSLYSKLLVQCYDYNGNPVTPESFAFVCYRKP